MLIDDDAASLPSLSDGGVRQSDACNADSYQDAPATGSLDDDVEFDVDAPRAMRGADVEDTLDLDVVETDADYFIDDTTETTEFTVIEGGSQRGRDLLVESAGYSYNVSKR